MEELRKLKDYCETMRNWSWKAYERYPDKIGSEYFQGESVAYSDILALLTRISNGEKITYDTSWMQ